MSKYIFITGGVVSGLGKGITAASLGKLIKSRGYSVEVVKFNPYFNIDSSNLCPEQYGETFITEDGRSCDLVIGHYERIMDESILAKSDITSGEIYSLIIEKERQNFYDGTTVQVVPHISDEIKRCVLRVGESADIVIVEVGGTVGDIEAQPYLEAIRQLKANLGKTNVAYVHVSLVPYIDVSGEQKTKPTQHSVRELQNLGIQPDVIVCRSDYPLGVDSRGKLSLFCNVDKDCVIESLVTPGIYEIPLMLEKEGFCSVVLKKLRLEDKPADLASLTDFCEQIKRLEVEGNGLRIGLVDKNSDRLDVHMSLRHALLISSVKLGRHVEIVGIKADGLTDDKLDGLSKLDGIIIPADVSDIALRGKRAAILYAKKHNIPLLMLGDAAFLGLCDDKDDKAVDYGKSLLRTDKSKFKYGQKAIKFKEKTIFGRAFGASVNQRFKTKMHITEEHLEGTDLIISGRCEDGVAAYESKTLDFFAAALFRPEFTARPDKPSPIFDAFLNAAKGKRKK